MKNVIEFPEMFKAKLIHSLKEIGYTPDQIEEALLFIEGHDEDPEPPPPKKEKLPSNVVDFIQFKRKESFRKAA